MESTNSGDNGRWVIMRVTTDERGKSSFVGVADLTGVDVAAFRAANAALAGYQSSVNLIDALYINRNEILASFVGMASAYIGRRDEPEQLLQKACSDTSRQLANTCSLFLSFRDHSTKWIRSQYGRNSLQESDWKQLQDETYNENLGYAIISELRNYVQHCDMPPLEIGISEKVKEEGITTRLDLSISKLLDDRQIKSRLGSRLLSSADPQPLVNLLDQWQTGFERLQNFVLRRRLEIALPHADYVTSARTRFSIEAGGRLSLTQLRKVDSGNIDLSLNWLPEDQALWLRDLDASGTPVSNR